MYIVNVEVKSGSGTEVTEIFKFATESQADAFCWFSDLAERAVIHELWPDIDNISDVFVSVKLMQNSTLMGYYTHCFTDYYNFFDDVLNDFMGREV